jgi:hypothetical protein
VGGVHFLASAIFRSDPPSTFLWGFLKDEVYVPPVPVSLHNLKARIRTPTAKIEQPLLQNVWHEVDIVLMSAGRKMEHVMYLHRL